MYLKLNDFFNYMTFMYFFALNYEFFYRIII